ncbi:MAG: von Willebrand factor type A domain-containing protein, partial [Magnetospirillum sp.]
MMRRLLPLICALAVAGCETTTTNEVSHATGAAPAPARSMAPPVAFRPMMADIVYSPPRQIQAPFKDMPDAPPSTWLSTRDNPVSTFSAEVDTASYAVMSRR